MKEEEMFRQVLEYQKRNWMPPDEEIYMRKLIRKDIRDLIKMERMAEYKGETTDSDMESDENFDRRIEDKVMFGSDSEMDINEFVINKFKEQLKKGEIEYATEDDYDDEYGEDEQDEDELEFDRDSGSIYRQQ